MWELMQGVSIWLKKFLFGPVDAILRFMFIVYFSSCTCIPRGVLPNKEVGGLGPHIMFGGKFGARSGQVHKIRGKIWDVLSLKDAKVGKKSQFWGHI